MSEIIFADMDGIGEIDLVEPFPAILLRDHYSHGDTFTEVIHGQSGIDFLHGCGILFCMDLG